MTLDDETKALAGLALRNAFYIEFSEMVCRYLAGAEGLGQGDFELQLGDLTSVFGRADAGFGDETLNINTSNSDESMFANCGHETMHEALTHAPAMRVYLRGKLVFERRKGEWFFVGDQT